MSLHYILDGYNIIYQIPQLTQGKLEEQRKNLVRYIETRSPQGSGRNAVTVVFDGRSDVWSDNEPSAVKVIFSKDQSADEEIRQLVSRAQNKKNIVVVTNDRDIQYAIGALGAKAMNVQDFFHTHSEHREKEEKQGRSSVPSRASAKNISNSLEHSINAEMKKIWMKKG